MDGIVVLNPIIPEVQQWTGRTVFQIRPDADMSSLAAAMLENPVHVMQWTSKQSRQLAAQVRCIQLPEEPRKYAVIEVFSPPRFGVEASKYGMSWLSADLSTGLGLQKEIRSGFHESNSSGHTARTVGVLPTLAGWAGGWYHLSKERMLPQDRRGKRSPHQTVYQLLCTTD